MNHAHIAALALLEFATAIPGGDFGVVPADTSTGFRATIREAGLGGGVLARSVLTSGNIGVRSRFAGGPVPTITYMFSTPGSAGLMMDGKELRAGLLMSRRPGQAPHLRTFQPQEIAGVVLTEDVLRRTFDAISGQEQARLLLAPATSRHGHGSVFTELQSLHRDATRMLDGQIGLEDDQMRRTQDILRAAIATVVARLLLSSDTRPDHLASQLRTRSMGRIERHIDDSRDNPGSLQELCVATGLALRTVEAIIRDRLNMSAQAYIRQRRLAFAREDLLKAAPGFTVTEVALQNGFAHFGRFAAYYRQAYGETPSRTLRG